MSNKMQCHKLPLILAVIILFGGGFITAWQEVRETGGADGNLQLFCQDRINRVAAPTTTAQECHHALLDLELVAAQIVIWRIDFSQAVFIASLVGVTALASGASTFTSCILFLVTFLASMVGSRAKSSYQEAHVLKHPRDARVTTLRRLLGAPENISMSYY